MLAVIDTTLAIRDNLPRTRRQASKGWPSPRLRELWQYRELLYFLVWRDIKVRYRQTALGGLWAGHRIQLNTSRETLLKIISVLLLLIGASLLVRVLR